jgi:predicted nucleotidyltransferase
MVSIPNKISDIIEKYIFELNELNIPIKYAFLFGSYAKGTYTDWSDIDLALVSDIFNGDRIEDRDKVRNITLSVSTQIEIMPFPTKDFNTDNPFAKEIIETGIQVI